MNEIYDGVITKPELNEETLTHYGIAKKVHKYIDKYLKNGKWIYRYKSKAQEAFTKVNRELKLKPKNQASTNYGTGFATTKNNQYRKKIGYEQLGSNGTWVIIDNGKAGSRSGRAGSKAKEGIEAGRKRVAKKKTSRPISRKKTVASGKVKVYKRSIK